MPWNGSGVFTRQYGTTGWQTDAAAGVKIVANRHDSNDGDLATGINTCLTKDGQNIPTANLPMGGFKHTGVAVAAALTDYLRASDAQNNTPTYLTTVAGTNTITAVAAYSMAAYATGQVFWFIPANANTGATTINVNGIGAKNIFWRGAALVGQELVANVPALILYDGTQFNLLDANVPDRILFRQTSSVLVSNTTTETDLFTFTVPANVLGTSRQILVEAHGEHLNDTGSSQTIQFRLVYGATNVFTTGAVGYSNNASGRAWIIRSTLASANATGAQSSSATVAMAAPGTVSGTLSNGSADFSISGTNTLAEDSTVAKTMALKVDLGTASASMTCRIRNATVTLV